MDLVKSGKPVPEPLELGQSITKTHEDITNYVHGFRDRKPISFVKPVATCAEAHPNTFEPPTSFYGVAAANNSPIQAESTDLNVLLWASAKNRTDDSLPLIPNPPLIITPLTTTTQISRLTSSSRGQAILDRRRRRRPNPFNSLNRTTIPTPVTLTRYRYNRSESEESEGMDSANSAESYNFDPEL